MSNGAERKMQMASHGSRAKKPKSRLIHSFRRARAAIAAAASAAMLLSQAGQHASAGVVWLDTTNGGAAGFGGGATTWDASTTPVWTIDPTGASLTSTYTAGSDVVFNSATATIAVNGTVSADSLTFQSNVVDTINNGASGLITLGGGGGGGFTPGINVLGTDNSATTINAPISLASATSGFTFSNAGTGLLTIGQITGAAGTVQTISIASLGAGGITLNGAIADGGGGGTVALAINNRSTGITTLSGADTFTGGISLQAGTLTVSGVGTLGGATSVLTLGDASADPLAVTVNLNSTAGSYANNIALNSGTTGTITLASSNASPNNLTLSGTITGTNNFTISESGTATWNFSNLVNNAGTITNSSAGAGAISFTGGVGASVTTITENSTTSALTIGAGGLTVGANTTLINAKGIAILTVSGGVGGTGNLTLNNNSTTANAIVLSGNAINNTGNITNSGLVTGATATGGTLISANIGSSVGNVTENSLGALTLSGTDAYTGTTTITQGTINLNGSGTLTATTGVGVFGGGLLNLGDAVTGIADRINTTATLTLGDSTGGGALVVIRGSTPANSQHFASLVVGGSAAIAGSAATGAASTVTFSGATPYIRTVGGLVTFTTANNAISFTTAPSGAGNVSNGILLGANLNGNDFVSSAGGSVVAPTYTPSTATAWGGATADTKVTVATSVTNDTTNSLNIAGATLANATVTLNGVNTITSGGIIVESLAAAAAAINGTGSLTTGQPNGDLWVYLNTHSLAFSAVIADNGNPVGLTYGGTQTLTLSGINTYTGTTTVQGSQLTLNTASANGSSIVAVPGNLNVTGSVNTAGVATGSIVVFGGSNELVNTSIITMGGGTGNTISLTGFSQTIAGLQTSTVNGSATTENVIQNLSATLASTLTVNNSSNYTFDGVVRNGGTATLALTKQGIGTLTLKNSRGAVTTAYTGATTISGGILALVDSGNGSTIGSFASAITNNATLELDNTSLATAVTFGAATASIAGAGTINVNAGTAAIVFNKANTFTGPLNVNTGTLRVITSATALGASTNTITVANGAALDVGVVLTNTNALVVNGSGPNGFGSLTDSSVIGTYAGAVSLGSASTIGTSSTFALTVSGPITGSFPLTLNSGSTGALNLTNVNNTGTVTNTSPGQNTTTITTLGTNVPNLIQAGFGALTITNAVTPSATLNTFTSTGVGLWTLTGGVAAGAGTNNLTFNANSSGGISVGAISSTGSITNSGTGFGTVTLSGLIGPNVTNVLQNSATSTLVISNASNTYTGTTTVTQGILSVANTVTGLGTSPGNIILGGATANSTVGVLSFTGGAGGTMTRSFTVNPGGGEFDSVNAVTLAFASSIAPSGPLTFGGAGGITLGSATTNIPLITGTNPLNKTGAGTFTLSTATGTAAIQSAMPINIIGGTLLFLVTGTTNTTNSLGTGLITISPGATLSTNSGGGNAVVTLGNTYTIGAGSGTASINEGAGGVNFGTGAVTFAPGSTSATILKLSNNNTTAATFTLGGNVSGTGSIQINTQNIADNITLTGQQNQTGSITNVGSSTSTATVSGTLGTNLTGINQAGANPFTVSSAVPLTATLNSFTSTGAGLFTFTGGFTGAQSLTFNANGTGSITVSGGAVSNAGNLILSGTSSGNITISSAINPSTGTGTIVNSGSGNFITTLSGNIGANITSITQSASFPSQLILSGTNTNTGNYSATSGVLDFTTTAALNGYSASPATAFAKLSAASGTTISLPFGGATSITATDVANLTNGTYSVFAAGSSLGLDTTNATSATTTLSTVIANTPSGVLGFTKMGTQTLAVSSSNTYTGPTAILNGTLSTATINSVSGGTSSSGLGAPTTVTNATIALGGGSTTGVLSYTGPGETTDRVINLAGSTGGGGLDQSGSGALIFTTNPTFTGIGSKTLTLSGSTSSDGTISGNVVGGIAGSTAPLTINKTGTGIWHLTGTGNTATTITISGGTLDTGPNGITLSDLGAATVQGNGVSGASATIIGKIILGGVGTAQNGADFGATVAGFTLNVNAVISGGATNNVDFFSNGTTVLGGANTFSGAVQVNGTTLVVTSLNNVGTNGLTPLTSSSLGVPVTSVNNSDNFGNQVLILASGTLKYQGTGETTDRPLYFSGTTAATTLDQSGTGLLKFLGTSIVPGGGAKTITLQGSTAGTGELAFAVVDNTTTNITAITKAGTGTWTLSGANTYTGNTTVSGGNLVLSTGTGTGSLANTHITVASGATLSVVMPVLSNYNVGNAGTASAGGTFTLSAGGAFNMSDGVIGNFNVLQSATTPPTAGTFSGGSLSFDIGTSTADAIVLRAGAGVALASGANAISLTPATGATSLTPGPYTLISGTGLSGNSAFFLASPTITVGGNVYNLSIAGTAAGEVLTVTNGTTAGSPVNAYWTGANGTSWNTVAGAATSFATGPSGSPDPLAPPGSGTNVYFTANIASNLSTSALDTAFTINSLTFTGAGTANIAGSTIGAGTGGSLQINAAAVGSVAAGTGIVVQAASGANTISAPVVLGANQTWTNSSSNALTVSGAVSGTGTTLTLTGNTTGGTFVLGGASTFTGNVTITGNTTVSVSSIGSVATPGALGQGTTVNLGTTTTASTLIYTGTGETSDKIINLAGTTGGAILDQSGTGNLKFTSALTITGIGAKTLTLQGSTAGTGEVSAGVADGGTPVVTTASVAPASNVNTITVTSAAGMVVGQTISGINIQPGTTITGIAANVITLSQNTFNGKTGVLNENISASYPTSITKAGTGTWTLSGNSSSSGNILVTGGTLNLTGTYNTAANAATAAAGVLVIQPTSAAVPSVVNVSGNFTGVGIRGSSLAGGTSVYNQTAGIVSTNDANSSAINYVVNNVAGAYGMFNLTGGTYRVQVSNSTNAQGGRFVTDAANLTTGFSTAVMYVGGGANPALFDNTSAEWFINGYSLGQVTVMTNGTIDHTGSSNPFALFMDTAQTGGAYGVFNLAGGNIITGAQPIQLGNSTANGTNNSGFINLAAGTLSTGTNIAQSLLATGGNHLYMNYAGGTLKATGALSQLVPTSNAALTATQTIYGAINNSAVGGAPSFNGGLTIDTNTFAVTIPAATPLLGASGDGVTQANLTVSGGSGYVGAPAVQFSKPASSTGVPAAGYAQMSGGLVVGIVITDPGVYAPGETPLITLTGGGATTAATVTSSALATANANTGGLTKLGLGTLTIASANTFGGGVIINGGVLATTLLANGGSPSGIGSSTNVASNLVIDSATLQYTGAATTTDRLFTLTANSGTLDSSGAGAVAFTNSGAIALTGTGARTLTLTGTNTNANSLAALLADGTGGQTSVVKNGAGNWSLTNAANTYTGPTTINQGLLSASSIANVGAASSALGAPANASDGTIKLGSTTNAATLQFILAAPASTDRVIDLAGTTGGATLDASTPNGTGGVTFTSAFTASGAGIKTLTLAGTNTNANTIAGAIVDNSGTNKTSLTKSGAGTWVLTGTSTFTGATTVSAGALALGNGGNLGNTAVTVASGAAFAAVPGVLGATNSIGSSLTLSLGSAFTMSGDGTTSLLNVAGTGVFTGGLNSSMAFDIGGTTTAVDLLSITGAASGTGGEKITINFVGSTGLTAGSYTIITAASGLNLANLTLQNNSVTFGATAYPLTLTNNAGSSVLNVGAGVLGVAYWNGNLDASWNTNTGATNWATDITGATDTLAVPLSPTEVFFTATGATHLTTTLDANFIINSLNYTSGSASTTIAPGGAFALTLNAASTGNPGITDASANPQIITAPITLGGAQVWTNSGAGLLTVGDVVLGAFGLTVSGTGNTTFSGAISGTGTLIKTGAGTATLTGLSATAANNYSGLTTDAGGTLAITHATTAAFTGGLTFGIALGSTTVGSVDLTNANASFAGAFNVQTNSSSANTITIGSGKTLTLSGTAINVGYIEGNAANIADVTKLTIAGAPSGVGSLVVNNSAAVVQVGVATATQLTSGSTTNLLDLTTLASVSLGTIAAPITTLNVAFGQNTGGTLLLSNTANLVTATTITVGHSNAFNGGVGLLTLGTGTNVLHADTFNIGFSKSTGTLNFASQTAASPGTLTITNKAGTGAATINVGNVNATGTGGGATGVLDLRGHVATVSAGTLLIGNANSTTLTSFGNGTVSFDSGTFTVATLNMGLKTGASTGAATATLNVGGGAFNVNTAFTLGSQATAGTASAILNVTGGTFTSNVDILSGTASATSTITLDGGTLDLIGHNIGSAAITIDNVNLRSGTLQNVAEINGGANLVKTTIGTLTMAGSNSYTGNTNVQAGTVNFSTVVAGAAAQGLGKGTAVNLGVATTSSGTLNYTGGIATLDKNINALGNGTDTVQNSGSGLLTLSGTITKNSTILTLNGGSNGISVTGNIAGSGAGSDLSVTGGKTILAGTSNTYNGPTNVTSTGTLVVNGTLATSVNANTVTVNEGGLLAGNGTINRPVTLVNSSTPSTTGGQISAGGGNSATGPGSSMGKLTIVGATSFGTPTSPNQVTYGFKFNAPDVGLSSGPNAVTPGAGAGSTYDSLAISSLSVSGTVDVLPIFVGTASTLTGSYYSFEIISGTGNTTVGLETQFKLDSLTPFANLGLANDPADYSFATDTTGDVFINYNAAPEPTSMMLLGLGVGGLAMRRRRRTVTPDVAK
jgi:autotransporter-associated beta strand protein